MRQRAERATETNNNIFRRKPSLWFVGSRLNSSENEANNLRIEQKRAKEKERQPVSRLREEQTLRSKQAKVRKNIAFILPQYSFTHTHTHTRI